MIALWRPLFVLFAVLVAVGGPRHPRGSPVQMLADPAWISSHLFVLLGFVALLGGLIVAGVQDRTLGSVWTAWAGILGALLYGVAPLLEAAHLIRPEQFAPALMGVALWAIGSGLWHGGKAGGAG
jgi:hypothetical protein